MRINVLANVIKDEGVSAKVVSAGLMTASGIYATYLAGGNDGGLTPSGIDKVTAVYRSQLESVQEAKRAHNKDKA